MQIIQFGYGFILPFNKNIIQQLDIDIEELEKSRLDDIHYCWDDTLDENDPNKKMFVYASGLKFQNGAIPYSYHKTDEVRIPSTLAEGITKIMDKLYIKYVNKNIDYSKISWKFFSYYEK